jgi:hypothetical protein
MPLIDVSNPKQNEGIHRILKESGLLPQGKPGEKKTLQDELNAAGLSLGEILGRVREISENGETDSVRLGASKAALEMHGVLKQESVKTVPQVNITIVDSQSVAINPILIPR